MEVCSGGYLQTDLARAPAIFLLALLTESKRGCKGRMGRVGEVVGSGWRAGLASGVL